MKTYVLNWILEQHAKISLKVWIIIIVGWLSFLSACAPNEFSMQDVVPEVKSGEDGGQRNPADPLFPLPPLPGIDPDRRFEDVFEISSGGGGYVSQDGQLFMQSSSGLVVTPLTLDPSQTSNPTIKMGFWSMLTDYY